MERALSMFAGQKNLVAKMRLRLTKKLPFLIGGDFSRLSRYPGSLRAEMVYWDSD
jgi:hypothetical protein